MNILELTTLTWQDVRDLDASRAVALVPVGAIEAHGPHLPLGTDVIIADAMAREGARRLAARGLTVLLLPAVSYTAAPFAVEFPGTVDTQPAVTRDLVCAIADALARWRIPAFGIANAHFDPAHVGALREAVQEIEAVGRVRVAFPDLTRRSLAARLTDEFRSGASHAGRYEGSVVLAAQPQAVRRDVMTMLPANLASLTDAMRAGKTSFVAAGGPLAYFGRPADATAEEGRRTIAVLGALLEEAILAVYPAAEGA